MKSNQPIILPYRGVAPTIHPSCWLAPNATIVGDVSLGEASSCWFNCVIRGDVAPITIGPRVNIQDGAVLHATFNKSETKIDEGASIGHNATVHGAHVQAGALIGMNAVVLDGAVIGAHAVIAAGAVVLEGTVVPPRTLWAGVPAKQRREVRPELQEHLASTADRYVEYAGWFNR
ncbi:MAG: gamma carbonic anhydrase family protein [Crocinitomicaceae bacterium]|nr:gamma carbonic anhydrase family protein [Crocinitomicaceae bacterium]